MSTDSNQNSRNKGELALQTIAMPKDTNANGDIFGGWLVSQMDVAGGIFSRQITRGRSATVAIQNVSFLRPVAVGCTVSCYCRIVKTGRTSVSIAVEVWMSNWENHEDETKVADGLFVYVAIDDHGRPRPLPNPDQPAT